MTLQYSEQSLLKKLDVFLAATPSSSQHIPLDLLTLAKPRQIPKITLFQARLAVARLEKKAKSGVKKNWKVEETNYLMFLVQAYCQRQQLTCEQLSTVDWETISSLIPNRNGPACQFKFLSLSPPSISSAPWSPYEKQILHRIIQTQNSGKLNWRHISEQFYQYSKEGSYRSGKQCREHYCCFLKPNLKKGTWSDEEDYLLVCLFLRMGRKWSKMANIIKGRNQNAIKNRFFLLFQNKKGMKLSSPDLLKMVRRRKEKLQKTLNVRCEDEHMKEQQIYCHEISGQSASFDASNDRKGIHLMTTMSESEIFLTEEGSLEQKECVKVLKCEVVGQQEFERYINL